MKQWREVKAYYRRRREQLHREDPHCHWCKRLTYLPGSLPALSNQARMATIDHLKMKGDPQRLDGNPNKERRLVLACRRCNNGRKNPYVQHRHRSLEEAWRGAGHWPQAAYASGALPGEV